MSFLFVATGFVYEQVSRSVTERGSYFGAFDRKLIY